MLSPLEFSAIPFRKSFEWPGARRLAVYFALNLETYSLDGGLIEELQPVSPPPDVLNYSWCEYGNRVGVWRLRQLFDEFDLPLTVLVNSRLFAERAQIVQPFIERGDEIAAHGRTNSERQGGLSVETERALIAEAVEQIAAATGQVPSGWLSPWISESANTLALLHQAGIRYVLDWAADDQPVWLHSSAGPLLSVPYPQELNDSSTIIGRQASVDEFCRMIDAQFDEMLAQSESQPLVFAIALHTHISGQPFRIRALRESLRRIAARRGDLWITTARSIAQHFALFHPPA